VHGLAAFAASQLQAMHVGQHLNTPGLRRYEIFPITKLRSIATNF
jgi:hypothetical protein